MKNEIRPILLSLFLAFPSVHCISAESEASSQEPPPSAETIVPLSSPHELRGLNVPNEGKWFECRPERAIRLNDVRSMILPKPDLPDLGWPAGTPVEVTLVIQLAVLEIFSGIDDDSGTAIPLPVTVSSLFDSEWKTGEEHRLPEDYFRNNCDNALASTILDPAVNTAGSEMQLVWTTTLKQLQDDMENGLLVYLDTRDNPNAPGNIRSVILGAMPDGNLARLEIRKN